MEKFQLLYSTLKHLKLSQLFGQILNRLKVSKFVYERKVDFNVSKTIAFQKALYQENKYLDVNKFCFLNQTKSFHSEIDWNFLGYGKLWSYNLEYFDYLHQQDISLEEKERLINDFYRFSVDTKRVLEPYPVSLRTINIIRHTIRENRKGEVYLAYVYQELAYLHDNYEFHILGNHLLENAFALCLGGAFFNKQDWRDKAIKILTKELDEQILADGAHFELSPMYHNIIFFRVLELIDWYSTYEHRDKKFLSFCTEIASKMYSWLEKIQFTNGDIPLFNDAAKGITYDSGFLIDYANTLGIGSADISLSESGYRSCANVNYEIKMDLAQIGASYQPGHAHADTLSFILYYQGKPLFVEQGTSTYQIGERRNLERSTEAHNTVVVNGKNQSEVWGGFRVGKRAKTTINQESANVVEASHDGYKSLGITHNRKFIFEEFQIQIKDILTKDTDAKAYLHIHPDRHITKLDNNRFVIDGDVTFSIDGARAIEIEEYEYAESYNQYQQAQRLVISFDKELLTTILFQQLS